jgi:hypothetical protein
MYDLENFGDETVSGNLFGQGVTFATDAPSTEFGSYAGLGLDVPLSSSTAFFADTELLLTVSAQDILGYAGIRSRF